MRIRSPKVAQIAHMHMTFDPMCVTVLKGMGLVLKPLLSVHKNTQTQQLLTVSDYGIYASDWIFIFFKFQGLFLAVLSYF